jgi:hypothetical protein
LESAAALAPCVAFSHVQQQGMDASDDDGVDRIIQRREPGPMDPSVILQMVWARRCRGAVQSLALPPPRPRIESHGATCGTSWTLGSRLIPPIRGRHQLVSRSREMD